MWLLHGTTRLRAERIVQSGPDVYFVEPGCDDSQENFSTCIEGHVSAVGDSEEYARGKARQNPSDRGPALLAIDVPEEIVLSAAREHLAAFDDVYSGRVRFDWRQATPARLLAACAGAVHFVPGPTLERLLAVWDELTKEIREVR